MRIGIRAKIASMLIAFALVPLLAAVVLITVGVRHLRTDSVGMSLLTVATEEEKIFEVSLAKDIEEAMTLLNDPDFAQVLSGRNAPKSPIERAALDAEWDRLPAGSGPLAEVLNHPLSARLRAYQGHDPRMAEILLTDRFGDLMAATGRTEDYYQADEEWWQKTYAEAKGRICIPPVGYDPSSRAWSLDLCLPITDGTRLVGVAKIVSDISLWVGGPDRTVGGLPGKLWVARRDGRIVHSPGLEPFSEQIADWRGPITTGRSSGWRISSEGQIQAYVPVTLPERILNVPVDGPQWSMVLTVSQSDALAPVYRLSLLTLAVGLAIVLGVFVVGLYAVDRGVVRRIRRLGRAAATIERGNLDHRVRLSPPRVLGPDELDDLAGNFSRMVERVRESLRQLKVANELKENFIRTAGHELRTPISYILGMVRLMRDSSDPARLLFAVQSMGSKARRLDRIIQSIFKLLPEHEYHRTLHYSRVNLSELMEEVYLDVFPFVEKRRQQMVVECPDSGPVVLADRDKLRDVVENLVMNAIKFSPDGSVTRVRIVRQLGNAVAVTVQDQGPGIPESDIPHIFQPFFAGRDVLRHSSGTIEYGKKGIGLGLAISRTFARMHGGDLTFTTGPTGSSFTVTVPVEPPQGAPQERPESTI